MNQSQPVVKRNLLDHATPLPGLRMLLSWVFIALALPAMAAPKYWVGASGTTNAPTSGTWQTTTPTVWSDGTVDTANAGWVAADTAFFGGADGAYGIRVPAALTYSSMRFSASGYTLTNNAASTITGPGASTSYLSVDSGKTATIGTNITVSFNGTTRINSNSAPSGTLVIENGGIVQQTVNSPLVIQGSNSVVSVKTGGIFRNAFTGSGSPYLSVGFVDGDDATLSVDGGTVTIGRITASFWIPGSTTATAANMKGTVTVNGGTLKNNNAGSTAVFILGQGAGNVGTLNLNGGTVTINGVQGSATAGAPGAGTSILNFNGGILKAVTANVNFANGLTAAYVRNGGAVIDNSGVAITIGQTLLHTTNVLDNATDGGLTNLGSGTLTLTGANTYTGPTRVSAGKLITTTDSTGGGAYTVADGTTLEVQVNTFGTSLTNSSLTLGTSGNLTNNFTLGGNASDTIPAIRVNGALNLNGTVRVNVSGSLAGPSTNLLVRYGSISGAGSFAVGTLPSVPGHTGLLVNDTVNKELRLVYLPPSVPVQWATTSGNWDTTSLNWQTLGGGSPTNYYELSPVTFDDNAPFAATHTVTLTGNRTPGDLTVNSTNTYLLTGGFGITAGGTLTKSGTGTLILDVNSAHSGGTVVNEGTVQVGNGGTAGSLGAGDITDNGALVFNRSDASSVSGVISGSGSVTKSGGGTLTLAATNSYAGNTTVNAGKLIVQAASSGGGAYTVGDGATLEVQASGGSSTLQVSALTLGASGSLTKNFALGAGRSQVIPLVFATGNVALNGTVTVNVSGSGLAAGTYVLLQYAGSLTGSGSFVAGALPGISTLTNDTAAQQLKLIITTAGLVWDSGNTNNGGIIDAASGTWDLTAGNLVWNNAGVNVPFANGNGAIFAGADGAYDIKLGASVSPPTVTFVNSGYTLTNDTPQSITLQNVSTAIPKLVVAGGKTVTIGTNVTISCPNTTYYGNVGDTAGGTIILENGGAIVQTTANTFALDGAGTVASIKSGGLMRLQAGSTSGQIAIGANNTGNAPTISVDGGTIEVLGNGGAITVGNGAGVAAGVLTLNGGSVSMPATTIKAVTLGVQPGNVGTLNLNGGTLTVARVAKGNASAFATNNFNGGTLRAVSASFGSTFMAGLDRANVRNGGAVIDSGTFAITIDQALAHSDIAGDNATDGGLTKLGAGTLSLGGVNTFTGPTIVSNGLLAINGSLANGAVSVAPGATLGGTGIIGGAAIVQGTLAPGNSVGTLTLNSGLTLFGNLAIEVDKSLSPANDVCVVSGILTNGGTGIITVTNLGADLVLGDSFPLFSQPVLNGSALTIASSPGAGLAWTNKLAVDGSIAVVAVPTIAPDPTNITFSVSGNTLSLTWPGSHLGWLAQSNSVSVADANAWFDITGSDSVTNLAITINPSLPNVFYRLRHP